MQCYYSIEVFLKEGQIRELAGKELAEDRVLVGLMVGSSSPCKSFYSNLLVYYTENFCYVQEMRFLYMYQTYAMAFSSSTNLIFIIALTTASFSSILKAIFHNFGAHIVILYLHLISLKEGTM